MSKPYLETGSSIFWLGVEGGKDVVFRKLKDAAAYVFNVVRVRGEDPKRFHKSGLKRIDWKGSKLMATDMSNELWWEVILLCSETDKELKQNAKTD